MFSHFRIKIERKLWEIALLQYTVAVNSTQQCVMNQTSISNYSKFIVFHSLHTYLWVRILYRKEFDSPKWFSFRPLASVLWCVFYVFSYYLFTAHVLWRSICHSLSTPAAVAVIMWQCSNLFGFWVQLSYQYHNFSHFMEITRVINFIFKCGVDRSRVVRVLGSRKHNYNSFRVKRCSVNI